MKQAAVVMECINHIYRIKYSSSPNIMLHTIPKSDGQLLNAGAGHYCLAQPSIGSIGTGGPVV